MSRSSNFIGLNQEAQNFVENLSCRKSGRCETCAFSGFSIHDYEEWIDQNGKIYKEVLDKEIWVSGPMIYTCLQDEEGNFLFEWLKEDIF